MANIFRTLCKYAKEKGLQEPTLEVKMVGYEAKVRIGNKKWTSKPLYSSGKAVADASRKALAETGYFDAQEAPSTNTETTQKENDNAQLDLTPPLANVSTSMAADNSDLHAEFEKLRQFQQLNSS